MPRLSTLCIVAAVFLAATCAFALRVDVDALSANARRTRHHHAAATLGAGRTRGKVAKKFTTDACKNFVRFSTAPMLKEVADEIVALQWSLGANPTTVQTAEAKGVLGGADPSKAEVNSYLLLKSLWTKLYKARLETDLTAVVTAVLSGFDALLDPIADAFVKSNMKRHLRAVQFPDSLDKVAKACRGFDFAPASIQSCAADGNCGCNIYKNNAGVVSGEIDIGGLTTKDDSFDIGLPLWFAPYTKEARIFAVAHEIGHIFFKPDDVFFSYFGKFVLSATVTAMQGSPFAVDGAFYSVNDDTPMARPMEIGADWVAAHVFGKYLDAEGGTNAEKLTKFRNAMHWACGDVDDGEHPSGEWRILWASQHPTIKAVLVAEGCDDLDLIALQRGPAPKVSTNAKPVLDGYGGFPAFPTAVVDADGTLQEYTAAGVAELLARRPRELKLGRKCVSMCIGIIEAWKAGQKGKEFCLTKNVATKAEPATKFKSPSTWKYLFQWRREGDTCKTLKDGMKAKEPALKGKSAAMNRPAIEAKCLTLVDEVSAATPAVAQKC